VGQFLTLILTNKMPLCRKCGVELCDANWYLSYRTAKRPSCICKTCVRNYIKEWGRNRKRDRTKRRSTIRTRFGLLIYYAKKRGIECLLTFDEYKTLVENVVCVYCRGPLSEAQGHGLDRVDSTKEYSLDNLQPCCGYCNRAKREFPEAEFIKWLDRISTNWTPRKVA
jgi:hypothetical protein